jgi:alkylation response protein AidB-like acyl-CoA dehydrogenase
LFTLTADQELFQTTTARFLDATCSPTHIRELSTRSATFDAEFWSRGAELGWTPLLVPECAGGGAISGSGLLDLLTVAFQFGRHAAPGPLFGTNIVAAALGRWGSEEQHRGPLCELIGGSAAAAWCAPAPVDPAERGDGPLTAVTTGDEIVLNGTISCVEGAGEATYLLITATEERSRSHYLIAAAAPGVQFHPLDGLDATRRFSRVSLHDVRVSVVARVGDPGAADTRDAVLIDMLATLRAAEIVGAMQRSIDMTLQWTAQRYSFGRPLASYQEIKHRMADMRTALEAAAAVTERAAHAVGDGEAGASVWASAAIAYAGKFGPEAIQDCIQLHGGIGVTSEHDLHLLLRRAIVDARAYGTPEDFTQRLVGLLETMSAGQQ